MREQHRDRGSTVRVVAPWERQRCDSGRTARGQRCRSTVEGAKRPSQNLLMHPWIRREHIMEGRAAPFETQRRVYHRVSTAMGLQHTLESSNFSGGEQIGRAHHTNKHRAPVWAQEHGTASTKHGDGAYDAHREWIYRRHAGGTSHRGAAPGTPGCAGAAHSASVNCQEHQHLWTARSAL